MKGKNKKVLSLAEKLANVGILQNSVKLENF
jgi:hypothetical protein